MVRPFETRFAGFSDHPISPCLRSTSEDTENRSAAEPQPKKTPNGEEQRKRRTRDSGECWEHFCGKAGRRGTANSPTVEIFATLLKVSRNPRLDSGRVLIAEC